ncbi:MAG: extracellular solute-binding protein [Patescibacteria group bacterium]|nr:extracellular solute-binding protein [Patescibacteria group bacterium]
MRHRPLRLTLIILLLSSIVLLGASCGSEDATLKPIKLKIWRVWDEEDSLAEIIKSYRSTHPNVEFEYRKLRYEEYKNELLAAWARGEGPDIFSIPNSWVGEYRDFIAALPATLEIPKLVTQKACGFKKEQRKVVDEVKTYTAKSLAAAFVPAVASDVIFYDAKGEAQIYGLPLGFDNLVLYYNRDILDRASIPLPPKTWNELLTQVPKLVKENDAGELTQAAIALGASDNIPRYTDLLSLLMLQNGTSMGTLSEKNVFRSTLSKSTKNDEGDSFLPGAQALTFYTDLANPAKQAYSWNADLPDAFEAFTQGQLAYFLGYAYHQPQIKDTAPNLNFDIAPLPQVSLNQQTNYANYWVESVYNNSENVNQAWDFLYYATSKNAVVSYLNATKNPSALRELVAIQAEQDPEVEVFINQALTSVSWYHGRDFTKVEEVFKIMIDGVVNKEFEARDAVESAEKMINQNEKLKE